MKYLSVREKIEKILKKNIAGWSVEETSDKFTFKFKISNKSYIISNIFNEKGSNLQMRIMSNNFLKTINFDNIYKILPYEVYNHFTGINIELKNGDSIYIN